MKITKPTITRDPAGIWHCRVIDRRPQGQFLHSACAATAQQAYRNWVDAASREPWYYGIGGLDLAYHREQIQQMEANAAFRHEAKYGLLSEQLSDENNDEDESDYLDQRTQVLTGLATGEESSLLAFVKDNLGLKPEPWQERMMVALECGGCAPPVLTNLESVTKYHLDREIASLRSQGLLRPSPPIPSNYLANFGPNCS